MAAKTSFVTLRNNANLCWLAWKRCSRYDFFFTKRCVTDIEAITKKRGRKIFTRLKKRREKRNNGSKWTPLMHLSVNSIFHFFLFWFGLRSKISAMLVIKTTAGQNCSWSKRCFIRQHLQTGDTMVELCLWKLLLNFSCTWNRLLLTELSDYKYTKNQQNKIGTLERVAAKRRLHFFCISWLRCNIHIANSKLIRKSMYLVKYLQYLIYKIENKHFFLQTSKGIANAFILSFELHHFHSSYHVYSLNLQHFVSFINLVYLQNVS